MNHLHDFVRSCLIMWMIAPAAVAGNNVQADTLQSADAKIQRWIELLDAPTFSQRSDAFQKLKSLGMSAIHEIERLTRDGNAETSDRAFRVLKSHFDGNDATLKHAATEALGRIAANRSHAKSQMAAKALEPSAPPKPLINPKGLFIPIIAQGANRQMRIQIQGGNGRKEFSIEQNGRKFRFVEDKSGIRVERSNGKGGMHKEKFKNAEELKRKDAETYKMYQKISGRNNGFRIQIGGAPQGIRIGK